MSLPKRRIDADRTTPLGDVADLLGSADDEIEVRIGRNLYIVHKSEEILEESSETVEISAAEQMLRYAGAWKDQLDGEAFKRYLIEMREIDRDRPAPEFP
jgi:hypothetical protein